MLETMVPEGFAENYARAVEMIKTDKIGVCVAQKGEFLIGDAPAQSLSSDKPGIGPLGGVTWSEATVIVMPISRRFAISTEPEGGYIDLDQHGVEVLNKVQAASAFRHIIWHPSADLLDLVQTIRHPATESPRYTHTCSSRGRPQDTNRSRHPCPAGRLRVGQQGEVAAPTRFFVCTRVSKTCAHVTTRL